MHNVDKAFNKLGVIFEKRATLRLYELAIRQLQSEVKQDVYTKEQSRLRTELKLYVNTYAKLEREIKSIK